MLLILNTHTNENSVAIIGLGMLCLEDMALILFL